MIPYRVRVIAIWLAVLLGCGVLIAHTRFSTDMSAFLPRSPNPAQQILVDQLREGVVSRLILLATTGTNPGGLCLAALSRTMAHDLRAAPGFGIVNNGETDAFARDHDVLWRNSVPAQGPDITPRAFYPGRAARRSRSRPEAAELRSSVCWRRERPVPVGPPAKCCIC